MIQKIRRILLFLPLCAALLLAAPALSHSGEIVVKPGKFDHFILFMPEILVAGEEVPLKLEAVDAFNNLISTFGETGREFQITTSGSAVIKPTSFKSSSFVNGAMTLTLSDRVAETFSISIRESGSPLPILSKEITILPGKLTSFSVKEPRSVQAGEPFDIRIIAKDAFGNTVPDAIQGRNINLIFKGDADPKIALPSIPDFKGGATTVTLVSQKSGTVAIEVKDLISGKTGTGDKIEIVSGPVSSFRVFSPKEVIAGEPFELSIVAVDRFNNIAANYSAAGSGVTIESSGKFKPFPSTIPAYEFIKGQAKVDMRYDIAEDITLTVTEIGKSQKGTSDVLQVASPIPERYDITTPDSVIAGQKFKIKVTVYNQLGHVIKNYNLVGPDVSLATTGTGTLIPNRIPASEFVNGSAVVEVQYNKSEAFSIIPTPAKPGPAAGTEESPETAIAEKKQSPPPAAAAKQGKKEKKAKAKEGDKRGKEVKGKGKRSLEITNISLVETKKKSTLTIHIPHLDESVKYSVSTEAVEGKKWVVVKVKPPVSKVEKSLKFDSSFIGDVVVEEDEGDRGTVLVKVELLKPIRFHVTKEKSSLVVVLKQ
ncbi:MAG: hypothetical protein K8I29_12985 [Alphaproteobacteria bacterium]|uniref:Uncharacterized protein n=1 Tax=Candidatus Nitrobium versatile TaxID=2884831 RepID=A0A953M294_9BACT|nr:hypothetical protein [Candidatus Nitrobium versatile]